MLFEMNRESGHIIKVIGVGGGGSNAVTHMYQKGIVGVDFIICNTDIQALEISPVPTKIQLGPNLTKGMGAGNKPEVGRQACIESIDEIRRVIEGDTKMLFITAGMGGGTGTGAAPIIAKVARELEILTIGIVTIPFQFEGPKRMRQAIEGLEELKKNTDAIIIINNDKLRNVHASRTISEAFACADDVLTTAAKGIAEIITLPGKVNVDFQDVYTVMKDSGVAIMGAGVAAGEDRALRAVQMALSSEIIEDNNIHGARNILLNITTGKSEMTLEEMYLITEYIQQQAGYGTDLIWGHCHDESYDDQISVTVIATGFQQNSHTINKTEKNIVVLEDEESGPDAEEAKLEPVLKDSTEDLPSAESIVEPSNASNTLVFEVDLEQRPADARTQIQQQIHRERQTKEQQKALEELQQRYRQKRKKWETSEPPISVDLDSEEISKMEKTPAYLRRNVQLEDLPEASSNASDKWTLSIEDEEPIIRKKGNSFLHDRAD